MLERLGHAEQNKLNVVDLVKAHANNALLRAGAAKDAAIQDLEAMLDRAASAELIRNMPKPSLEHSAGKCFTKK